MWTKIKAKLRRWWIALLMSLGIIPAIFAASKDFTYDPATTYEDGTPLPLSEIAETRLYCDGDDVNPKASQPGASGSFSGIVFAPGNHTCYATHVGTNGLESQPSNSVAFQVLPDVPPNAPGNLTVN